MTVRWDVRERIGDLFAQYRRYGRGKAGMVRKNGLPALRLRHLVPPTAVGGGAGLLIGGLVERWLLAPFAPYLALLLVTSALAWRRRAPTGRTSAVALPAAFLVIHAGWGLGFLEGLLGRKPARASGSGAVRSEADESLLSAYEEVSRKRDVATSVPPT